MLDEQDRVLIEIDHIVPRSRGGANSLDNLQALCRPCNLIAKDIHYE